MIDYSGLLRTITDYYLKIKKKNVINSNLVDQLSNSDDDSLSVDDRHA